jgi:hypothetical protein
MHTEKYIHFGHQLDCCESICAWLAMILSVSTLQALFCFNATVLCGSIIRQQANARKLSCNRCIGHS